MGKVDCVDVNENPLQVETVFSSSGRVYTRLIAQLTN